MERLKTKYNLLLVKVEYHSNAKCRKTLHDNSHDIWLPWFPCFCDYHCPHWLCILLSYVLSQTNIFVCSRKILDKLIIITVLYFRQSLLEFDQICNIDWHRRTSLLKIKYQSTSLKEKKICQIANVFCHTYMT